MKDSIKKNVVKLDLKNIYDVLDYIKYRPSLFISRKHITTLWDFLSGYQMAATFRKSFKNQLPQFSYFSFWVKGRVKSEYDFSAGWYYHLLSHFKNDEEKAFEYFFEILEEFKTSIPVCEIINIEDSQRNYYKRQNEHWVNIFNNTTQILIFKLPPSKVYWSVLLDNQQNDLSINAEYSKKELLETLGYDFNSLDNWTKLNKEDGLILYKKVFC
jgi:hypothetical protein